MYSIKCQYAKDENNKVINVFDLHRAPDIRKKSFFCFSCNQQVVPVLGDVRQKHFRHLSTNDYCSFETYLHNLSKQLFFEVYSQCLETNTSFDIELQQNVICNSCKEDLDISCPVESQLVKFSVTRYFSKIYLEHYCDGYIPDVLLTNEKGEKLFIEFAVTHFSSCEKVKSGVRIIELFIFDETSLRPIYDRLFSQADLSINFMNFVQPETHIVKKNNCNKKFYFFMLKTDGSAYILEGSVNKYRYQLAKCEIAYSKRIAVEYRDFLYAYRENLISAYRQNLLVKNCFLCRYHAINNLSDAYYLVDDTEWGPIFCKFLRKVFTSTFAVTCQYYRPDPKVF